jgi:hypothetical protein
MPTEDFRRIFVPGHTGGLPVHEVCMHCLWAVSLAWVRPVGLQGPWFGVGQVGLNVYRRHFGSLFEQWMFAEFVICWFEMAFNPKMPK